MSNNKVNQTPLAATIAKGQMNEPEQATSSVQSLVQTPVQSMREGSTLYYATLKLRDEDRQQILNALNLIKTLSSCLTGVHDPSVAQTKLQWWSDEISRLALNEPRHPTTKQCAKVLAANEHVQAQLTHILDAATAARFDAPDGDDTWRELMQRDYAARLSVLQTSLGDESKMPLDEFALAIAWVDILSSLPSRIHHDGIAFPPTFYERFNVSTQELRKQLRVEGQKISVPQSTSKMQPLLDEAIDCAERSINEAIKSASYEQLVSKNQRALVIWLQIRRAQLHLWKKQQPNLFRETMTLTPLKKWYIAFRYR